MDLPAQREREGFVTLDLVHEPDRNTVPAELFGQEVLMEVNDRVYPCLSCGVHYLDHRLQIGLVIRVFFGLYPRPHES